jgi:hypothetical protein
MFVGRESESVPARFVNVTRKMSLSGKGVAAGVGGGADCCACAAAAQSAQQMQTKSRRRTELIIATGNRTTDSL